MRIQGFETIMVEGGKGDGYVPGNNALEIILAHVPLASRSAARNPRIVKETIMGLQAVVEIEGIPGVESAKFTRPTEESKWSLWSVGDGESFE